MDKSKICASKGFNDEIKDKNMNADDIYYNHYLKNTLLLESRAIKFARIIKTL